MADEPDNKKSMTYSGIVIRILVAAGVTAWLWSWEEKDLSKLTNIVTVLAVAIPVVALFDTRLLTWIVGRWSAAVAAAKAMRARNPWRDFMAWRQQRAATKARNRAERDAQRRDAAAAKAVAPVKLEVVKPEPAKVEVEAPQPMGQGGASGSGSSPGWSPGVRSAAAILIVIGMAATALLMWQPWASAPVSAAVVEAEPPPVHAPVQPPAPPPPRSWLVKSTDRCWSMAQRCTGDWKRWVELGPLNNIDVSNVDSCLIVAGRQVLTPGDWPEDCLEGP